MGAIFNVKGGGTLKDVVYNLQLVFAALGGYIGWFLGGFDGFLYALVAFVVLDYITGVMVATLDVLVSPIFGVRASFAGIVYDVVPFTKPEKVKKTANTKPKKQKYIPDDSHYYKYGHQLIKKVTFEDNDIAILKMPLG
jgi:hypothetical protein